VRGRKRQDEWEDDWDDEWADDWEEDAAPKSPIQRFMDWSGLSSLGRKKQSADDDDELDPDDDDPEERSNSPVRHFADWGRLYWQRMLAIVFFAIGLILILRLAVLSI